MDIKILDSWLREFIKTPAIPEEIARDLSLTSQSVEKTTKLEGDVLYDIEVSSNRPDAFSVYGIARELAAVLPRFNLKTKLLPVPGTEKAIPKVKKGLPLQVTIAQSSLVPRFTALVFDKVTIKPSPDYVQKRLAASGIRSLNNVIDISNYLMLELGQPMHTFDYDKILGAKMTVRQAKEDEKIITLDGQERRLPPGTIIIEDGEKRIIDLCGIMGGKNSEVDENTKRVLLFIQTYDPISIRRSCQGLGFRTEAASRFEKGIDPEGVIIAMKRAVGLFEDWAGAKVASKLFDIYSNPPKPVAITLGKSRLDKLLGIEISLAEAKKILESLGFETKINQNESLTAKVPHWRLGDVSIPEDLIEEIARIYGYFNLPNNLPPISFPRLSDAALSLEDKLKTMLKFWGYTESPTYSLTSETVLEKAGVEPDKLLRLANPLSEDLVFLRVSLLPSLLEVVVKNISSPEIKIFEIDNIYLPQEVNQLPDERPKLSGLFCPGEYAAGKGLAEQILNELGVENVSYLLTETIDKVYDSERSADILAGKEKIGSIGEVDPKVLRSFGIEKKVAFFDFDIKSLFVFTANVKRYQPVSKYPPIIEDLSFEFPSETPVGPVIQLIKQASSLIKSIELIDAFDRSRTFRLTYQSSEGNLTDKDIQPIREKIIQGLSKKGVKIKQE